MDTQSIGTQSMKTAHKSIKDITSGRDSFGTNIIYMRQSCIMKSHESRFHTTETILTA